MTRSYSGEHDTAQDALDYYGYCRTLNAKGVTIPSQIRYVHYFARWFKSNTFDVLPSPKCMLSRIRLVGVPRFERKGGCSPYYRVKQYQAGKDGSMEEVTWFDLKEHGLHEEWLTSRGAHEIRHVDGKAM